MRGCIDCDNRHSVNDRHFDGIPAGVGLDVGLLGKTVLCLGLALVVYLYLE